jgi:hypothetical protein
MEFPTAYGTKKLSVVAQDVTTLDCGIDVLTTSAFAQSYVPTPGSIFYALAKIGVKVSSLARDPYIDLRDPSNIWLSQRIENYDCPFRRIGCIESQYSFGSNGRHCLDESRLLSAIKSYFYMLDIASASGVRMETVAMPLLGTGSQRISQTLIVTPLLNECVAFLKRNESVQHLLFVERNVEKAMLFVETIKKSYALFRETAEAIPAKAEENTPPMAFISYTTPNRNVADNLCFKLESRGIKVWYAPRNVEGPYAASIASAIERANFFIVVLSQDSMVSEHMLNEIDLAFKRLPNHIKFKPLRIDTAELAPSFNYYLSRQHWMDAHLPPLETRLNEFVESLVREWKS